MDFHTRVTLDELKPGDTVIIKDDYFEFLRFEEKSPNTYWLHVRLIRNGQEYRYPWPKTAAIRITGEWKEEPVNDDKNAHTDRHDGGPTARAQRVIDREKIFKDREANERRFIKTVLEMRDAGKHVFDIAEATQHTESSVLKVLSQYYDGITDPAEIKAKLGAVTRNIDYVKIAKDQLVEYINEQAEITDGFKIDVSYLYVVWFSKTLENWKCLISTSLPDGMYYELTFSGAKDELYIDAYKKFRNKKVVF